MLTLQKGAKLCEGARAVGAERKLRKAELEGAGPAACEGGVGRANGPGGAIFHAKEVHEQSEPNRVGSGQSSRVERQARARFASRSPPQVRESSKVACVQHAREGYKGGDSRIERDGNTDRGTI